MTGNNLFGGDMLPADVIRAYLAEDPARTNGDAAIWVFDHFPKLDEGARHLVWNLRTPRRTFGMDDELFNRAFLEHMREAGYV